uniref:F-box domain and ankyrin repeat protein n=1 Tax=Pithovirus LCPAC304 TaxID=2506594 RepID=A0A481ZBE2_9VIRU|nr:MAG: F-box domain and ankyrin repeat protein [Pithovirus LCPAC304]
MDDPLAALTVKKLRAIARTYKLKGRSKPKTKADLVAFLREHLTVDQIEKGVGGTPQRGVELADMPAEVIWEIMYNLPPRDALHVCATQKGAHEICQTDAFWKEKIQRDFGELFDIKIDIPTGNRLETYKSFWKEAHEKLPSCAEKGHLKCVESLLQLGVNPDSKIEWGGTALYYASWRKHANIVRLLLEHDADPDLRSRYGNTPLMEAYENGDTDIVQLLLEHDADPDIRNSKGWTTLMDASFEGSIDMVQLVLKHGAELNTQPDYWKSTSLMLASLKGHTDIVRLLLSNNADMNRQDHRGYTALMMASENGFADIVQLLLDHGADPDLQGHRRGYIALNLASIEGHTDIVRLLK